MRHWGILVTCVYAVVLAGLLVPLFFRLGGINNVSARFLLEMLPYWLPYAAILIAGQAALLFISVDTGWRRIRPRLRAEYSAVLAGVLTAFLVFALAWSLAASVFGDDAIPDSEIVVVGIWLGLWLAWTVIFRLYYQNRNGTFAATMSWILRGSVLELLVAVPCHIIVRNRGDCSAPAATSFGIVTGIAIMLMCFGPGVLALYRRRLEQYPRQRGL